MFNRELLYVYIYIYVYLVRATYFFTRVSNLTRYLGVFFMTGTSLPFGSGVANGKVTKNEL